MRLTDKYILFWESCFSNFYPAKIKYAGEIFLSSEHLFMYLKAMVFGDLEIATQITKVGTPKEAKALGRKIKGFNEQKWNKVREACMQIAVTEKFRQNEDLCDELFKEEYRGLSFVEASPLDKIWGIGLHYDDVQCDDPDNWHGLNLLGETLDRIRVRISKEKPIFVVENQISKCPNCGCHTITTVAYKNQLKDIELEDEKFKMILEKCGVPNSGPEWNCSTCGVGIYTK